MAIWWKDVVRETQATGRGPFLISRVNDSNRKRCSGVPPALTSALARAIDRHSFIICYRQSLCLVNMEVQCSNLCIRVRLKRPQRAL